jgi:hypothetical protein
VLAILELDHGTAAQPGAFDVDQHATVRASPGDDHALADQEAQIIDEWQGRMHGIEVIATVDLLGTTRLHPAIIA